eukprot:Gb_32056 [translate_table: standard]
MIMLISLPSSITGSCTAAFFITARVSMSPSFICHMQRGLCFQWPLETLLRYESGNKVEEASRVEVVTISDVHELGYLCHVFIWYMGYSQGKICGCCLYMMVASQSFPSGQRSSGLIVVLEGGMVNVCRVRQGLAVAVMPSWNEAAMKPWHFGTNSYLQQAIFVAAVGSRAVISALGLSAPLSSTLESPPHSRDSAGPGLAPCVMSKLYVKQEYYFVPRLSIVRGLLLSRWLPWPCYEIQHLGKIYLCYNIKRSICQISEALNPLVTQRNSDVTVVKAQGKLGKPDLSQDGTFEWAWKGDEILVNVCLGPKEDRVLMTGLHTVNDIYCSCCHQILGWKYEKAYEEQEKYKEGKYIIEKTRMLKEGLGCTGSTIDSFT